MAQVVAEQPVVEEGLVELLGEERLHHRVEEGAVLLPEEEVQLVAGELLVERLLLGERLAGPRRHEREPGEIFAARDRHQQPERAVERVVDLDLCGPRVGECGHAARGDEFDAPLLDQVLAAVEGLREAAGTWRHRLLVAQQRALHGLVAVQREHGDGLAVAEVGDLEAHHAVLVGREVLERCRAAWQVVEVGEEAWRRGEFTTGCVASARLVLCRSASPAVAAARPAAEADGGIPRVVHLPGIQQQARPLQHVARELRREAPLEHVAVLVAQASAGLIEALRRLGVGDM